MFNKSKTPDKKAVGPVDGFEDPTKDSTGPMTEKTDVAPVTNTEPDKPKALAMAAEFPTVTYKVFNKNTGIEAHSNDGQPIGKLDDAYALASVQNTNTGQPFEIRDSDGHFIAQVG